MNSIIEHQTDQEVLLEYYDFLTYFRRERFLNPEYCIEVVQPKMKFKDFNGIVPRERIELSKTGF